MQIIFNGTTIEQWSATPPYFNGVACKKVYFNNNYVYNWLSMNYTKNFAYLYQFGGCAGAGYSGAYCAITREGDVQYKVVLYAADMAADYNWKGSATSSTIYVNHGTYAETSIRFAYSRDQTTVKVTISFEGGSVVVREYNRCKDGDAFALRSTTTFEG